MENRGKYLLTARKHNGQQQPHATTGYINDHIIARSSFFPFKTRRVLTTPAEQQQHSYFPSLLPPNLQILHDQLLPRPKISPAPPPPTAKTVVAADDDTGAVAAAAADYTTNASSLSSCSLPHCGGDSPDDTTILRFPAWGRITTRGHSDSDSIDSRSLTSSSSFGSAASTLYPLEDDAHDNHDELPDVMYHDQLPPPPFSAYTNNNTLLLCCAGCEYYDEAIVTCIEDDGSSTSTDF